MVRVQCPGCGRSLEIADGASFFQKSRPPANPSQSTDRCGVCGGPLPPERRTRWAEVADAPTILPAEQVEYPIAHPLADELPLAVPIPRTSAEPPHAPKANFLGIGRLGWSFIGMGCVTALLGLIFLVVALVSLVRWPTVAVSSPPSASQSPVKTRDDGKSSPTLELPGLLAYWNLDEGEGVRVADSSGNGCEARVVNAQWTQGVRGKALRFTGEDSYLDYSDSPLLSFAAGAPFTVAFWVRTTRDQGTLLSQRNSHDGSPVLDMHLKSGCVSVQIRQDGNEFNFPVTVGSAAVNDGNWHHVALTRDGDELELFLDGVSQKRNAGAAAGGAITTDLRAFGSERYWINRRTLAFGDPHFEGDMDELCFFSRALKAEEIKELARR